MKCHEVGSTLLQEGHVGHVEAFWMFVDVCRDLKCLIAGIAGIAGHV